MTDEATVNDRNWLAASFEQHRPHLRSVAFRILGSPSEADDAVQEAWLRLERAGTDDVGNLGGWLTTVVSRVCLDVLRARRSHREAPIDEEAERLDDGGIGAERELMLADSLGPALMIVLDTLAPAERVAFVLHDLFGLAFEDVAAVLGRTPVAARQLASRGRRRVRGVATTSGADAVRQRELVSAFLAASRDGDIGALLAVLDPEVVLDADDKAVEMAAAARYGVPREIRGAETVARFLKGRARGARLALVDGVAAAAWAPGGNPRVVFHFDVAGDRIAGIHLVADPAALGRLEVVLLEAAS